MLFLVDSLGRLFCGSWEIQMQADDRRVQLVKRFLIVSITTLIAFHLLGQFSAHILDRKRLMGFVGMFRMQSEMNAPTFFSGLLLLSASALLLVIGVRTMRRAAGSVLPWFGLSAIFCFLAFDEVLSIHENYSLGSSLAIFDGLKYKWVIMGTLLVVAVIALFFRFWLRLPRATRFWFGLSAAVYVGGAIGFETISGLYAKRFTEDFGFSVLIVFEEGMEMIGVAMFIVALTRYLAAHLAQTELSAPASHVAAGEMDAPKT